jgi:predicted nucleic acid-binding protein
LIAADTSSLLNYFHGETSEDAQKVLAAIEEQILVLPAPVITELLSRPATSDIQALLDGVPRLPLVEGFWERAGISRAQVLARGLKARLADSLIAQSCIDADVPLIARGPDFRHFAAHCGLKLA